jgi:hypothetical protein
MCFRQIGGHAFRILAPGCSNLEKIARAIFSQARRPPTEASGKVLDKKRTVSTPKPTAKAWPIPSGLIDLFIVNLLKDHRSEFSLSEPCRQRKQHTIRPTKSILARILAAAGFQPCIDDVVLFH